MAYFAELDENNVVLRVISVNNDILLDDQNNEIEQQGIDFCTSLFGGTWLQTSYNTVADEHTNGKTPFRKNFAGIGSVYYPEHGGFALAKPYEGWILNSSTLVWESPVPYPQDGNKHFWDNESLSWVEVPIG
jgi:hypothetical protein